MPDYIYLLENRLSPAQRDAVQHVRQAAREAGLTVFLAGGAVRDLTSGFPVRDLDFSVQGNAFKLKKTLEKSGAELWGEHAPTQTLFYWFAGSVRVEISSTRREEYPKPGKPVYHWATMLEDLRRRDFTANAMAISLNEGSYGLLLDPLNGIADIEARHLRLVHNYGFLEDPSRMIRAVRLAARTGWQMDERTQIRYQNAKDEGVISSLGGFLRGYELEEIGHEEDALKALKALEAEGWMEHLFPGWTSAKADLAGLEQLHQLYVQLLMQGVHPDLSAAQMQLLTAKLQPKELTALKKELPRHGFVAHWDHLDEAAKEFAVRLTGKEATLPSATWKLIANYPPEAVLWLAFTSKAGAVQSKFKNFFSVWPEARQKMPVQLMAEMRITAELPEYNHLLNELFFALIDGKLESEEAMRAFLEPYSPPAPPPPVSIRRSRSRKAESKAKVEDEEEELDIVTPAGYDEDDDLELDEDEGEEEHEEEEEERAVPVKPAPKPASGKTASAAGKPAAAATAQKSVAVAPKREEKPVAKAAPAVVPAGKGKAVAETKKATPVAHVVAVPASKVPTAKVAAKAAPAKVVAAPAKTGKPATKAVVKKAVPAKPAPKGTVKAAPAKAAAKPVAKKKH